MTGPSFVFVIDDDSVIPAEQRERQAAHLEQLQVRREAKRAARGEDQAPLAELSSASVVEAAQVLERADAEVRAIAAELAAVEGRSGGAVAGAFHQHAADAVRGRLDDAKGRAVAAADALGVARAVDLELHDGLARLRAAHLELVAQVADEDARSAAVLVEDAMAASRVLTARLGGGREAASAVGAVIGTALWRREATAARVAVLRAR